MLATTGDYLRLWEVQMGTNVSMRKLLNNVRTLLHNGNAAFSHELSFRSLSVSC